MLIGLVLCAVVDALNAGGRTSDQLDALDRKLRERLRGLLAVSRDYNVHARRLYKVLSLDDATFEILGDDKLRAIMGDQTQIWDRARRSRNLEAPQWLERLERQQVAVDVYNDLQKGRYLIPLDVEVWAQREDLEDDLRRAKDVLDKARFVREAANKQLEKEQELKDTWARLFSEPDGRVTKLALEAKNVGDMVRYPARSPCLCTNLWRRCRLRIAADKLHSALKRYLVCDYTTFVPLYSARSFSFLA